MSEVREQKPFLLAYVSADRLGHELHEIILHCSYAESKGCKLLLFFSPNTVNKELHVLKSDSVKFVHWSRFSLIKYFISNPGESLKLIKYFSAPLELTFPCINRNK